MINEIKLSILKAAIEREKSDARISSSECEQARSAASIFLMTVVTMTIVTTLNSTL